MAPGTTMVFMMVNIVILVAVGIGLVLTIAWWLRTRNRAALYGVLFFVVLGVSRLTPDEQGIGWVAWAINLLVIATGTAFVVSATRKAAAAPRPTKRTSTDPENPT